MKESSNKDHIRFYFVFNVQNTQIRRQKVGSVVVDDWEGGKWRVTTNRYKVSFVLTLGYGCTIL